MKVLILSCNTGGGHNSAAKAIKEAFDERGHYCCVMDALSFGGQKASDLVCDTYIEMVKKHQSCSVRFIKWEINSASES